MGWKMWGWMVILVTGGGWIDGLEEAGMDSHSGHWGRMDRWAGRGGDGRPFWSLGKSACCEYEDLNDRKGEVGGGRGRRLL